MNWNQAFPNGTRVRTAYLEEGVVDFSMDNGGAKGVDENFVPIMLDDGSYRVRYPYNVQAIEPEPEESDPVNAPSHYTFGSNGVEVIDIVEHLNFCRGSAVKYICRAGRKNPDKELEDLRKAKFNIEREIARLEG